MHHTRGGSSMSVRQSIAHPRSGAAVTLRVARHLASLVTLAALAACSRSSPADPADASLVGSRDGKGVGPSGLEQRLVTKVEAPPAGSPYAAILTATSTIVNTGSAPAHVVSRTCFFQETDFETTAKVDRFEPLISCAAVSMATDLAPGQSTGPLDVQFGVRSGPGTYTLALRHSLAPEFRAAATFRIP
jgi:hypothetical protein